MTDAAVTTEEYPPVPGLVIHRYGHGGGRVFFELNGKRDLVMDLYDDEPGARRDAIIKAVIEAGILGRRGEK